MSCFFSLIGLFGLKNQNLTILLCKSEVQPHWLFLSFFFSLRYCLRLFEVFVHSGHLLQRTWKSLLVNRMRYFAFGSQWAGLTVTYQWSRAELESVLPDFVMEGEGRNEWGQKLENLYQLKGYPFIHRVIRLWSSSAIGSCWDWEFNKIKKGIGQMRMSTDFSKYLYNLI